VIHDEGSLLASQLVDHLGLDVEDVVTGGVLEVAQFDALSATSSVASDHGGIAVSFSCGTVSSPVPIDLAKEHRSVESEVEDEKSSFHPWSRLQ
jgi:hypothetical protein